MSYFILMGRRIPKQAITGFKFQNETDNIRPFLSIRIRGKDKIIPFKDKKEIQSVKAHLCSIFSGFVKIGVWYLRIQIYKKHCEGLRKHIANLERRLLKHALANVILSIISVAAIIALFTLIQN